MFSCALEPCDKYQISDFFLSRLTQAANAQAGLCIGISSTESSFAWKCDNRALCDISDKTLEYQKKVIRTYFLKNVVTGNTQSEHLFRACTACRDTKMKILNQGPRVSNGLDIDHD